MSRFGVLMTILSIAPMSFARVVTIDNNPNSITQFTTLQQAYDNALDKDTIFLMPSATSYGNLTPNGAIKRLYIFGNGYFLNQNVEPWTRPNILTSKTGKVVVDNGMSGSLFSGLEILGNAGTYQSDGGFYINAASNITIKRNYFTLSTVSNLTGIHLVGACSNIIITQNYCNRSNVGYSQYFLLIEGGANVLVSNNFINFSGSSSYYAVVAAATVSNVNFSNNILSGNINAPGATFYSNIYRSATASAISAVGPSYNNLCQATDFPSGNGNVRNVDMTTVFVGVSTSDSQWQLKAGSPALGAGYSGADCGIFGGPTPYVLSGISSLPSIYSALVPSVVSGSAGTMNITVKIKANN